MVNRTTGDELATREQGALMRANWGRFMSRARRVRWGVWAALLMRVVFCVVGAASWWNDPDGGGLFDLLQLGGSAAELGGKLREVFGKGSVKDRGQALLSHDGAVCPEQGGAAPFVTCNIIVPNHSFMIKHALRGGCICHMISTNPEAVMGGFGSGASGTGKATCEGALFLDVRLLKRQGWLAPGSSVVVTWKMGASSSSVEIKASADKVRVSWASGGIGYAESLPRCSSPQPLGGERAWWSCPGCSSRCAILYMRSMRWRCRACHELVHASTRDRCPIERVRRKHRLVALKLGLTGDAVHAPDMNAPLFPERPKGMHGATYTKLIQQHLSMRAEAIQAIIKALDR